jgi:hypothetical protein
MGQVLGTKTLYLWPPLRGQILLYLGRQLLPIVGSTRVTDQSDLTKLMAHSAPISIILNPGDLGFIPAGWWHTTETTELSITVSGNFMNSSNWKEFLVLARHEGLLDLSDTTTAALDELMPKLPNGLHAESGS